MQTRTPVEVIDWGAVENNLNAVAHASLGRLLTPAQTNKLIKAYDDPAAFRSTVKMARYNFGRGAYKYFAHPFPDVVAKLRSRLYPPLAGIANKWADQLGASQYPKTHKKFIAACEAAGQTRPTPLILRY